MFLYILARNRLEGNDKHTCITVEKSDPVLSANISEMLIFAMQSPRDTHSL